jgi:hypothetical protein
MKTPVTIEILETMTTIESGRDCPAHKGRKIIVTFLGLVFDHRTVLLMRAILFHGKPIYYRRDVHQ